jgi:hypothetical protein
MEEKFDVKEEFKKFLAKKYKLEGNPKLDRAFEIAWELGHSSGYDEIENYFYDLVDLIKN